MGVTLYPGVSPYAGVSKSSGVSPTAGVVGTGSVPLDIRIASVGQSNASLWGGGGGWDDSGETAFLAKLAQYNPAGTNLWINGANGGSYLTATAADQDEVETSTLSSPFTTTNGSPVVTVAHTDHDLIGPGQRVDFSGASAVGGITINGTYYVTDIINANSYTITHSGNASSGATGGGTVTYSYKNGEIWVIDRDADSNNWEPGQMLLDFNDAVSAQIAANLLTGIFIANGEADSFYIPGTLSKANFKLRLEWLLDYFDDTYSGLVGIVFRDLARRTNAPTIYQEAREVIHEIAVARANVYVKAPSYSYAMRDQVHLDDYTEDAENAALAFLELHGATGTPAWEGPSITNVSLTDDTLTFTVDLDGASALNGYSGTPIDVTPDTDEYAQVRVFSASGVEYPHKTVTITGANTFTLQLDRWPTGDLSVYCEYQSMNSLDLDNLINNGSYPLRYYKGTVSYTAPTGDWAFQQVDFNFAQGETAHPEDFTAVDTNIAFAIQRGARVAANNTGGSMRDFISTLAFTDTDTATRTRRSTAAIADEIIHAATILELPSAWIEDAQIVTVSMTSTSATGTGVISNPVDVSRSIAFVFDWNASSATPNNYMASADFTDADGDEITVTNSNGVNSTHSCCVMVVQFVDGIIDQIEDKEITIATSAASQQNNLTNVFDLGRTLVFWRGMRKTAGTATAPRDVFATIRALKNGANTALKAERGNAAASDSLVVAVRVAQFAPGLISVQRGEVVISGGAATGSLTLANHTLANSFINWLGSRADTASSANETEYQATIELAAAAATGTRPATSSVYTASIEVATIVGVEAA